MKKILDAIYLTCSIIGATIVASNSGYQLLGYVVFMISSIAGMFLIMKSNISRSVLIVNVIYLAINAFGIYRSM